MSSKLERKNFLLHPIVDFLMIGGASIIFFTFILFFIDMQADLSKLGWIMFYLSFAINFPHFLVSYQILYYDNAKSFFEKYSFVWAGIIVPLILLAFFSYALISSSLQLVGWGVLFMFLTVGWHYVKQIYGCIIVTSTRVKFYFSKWERYALRGNLFLLWFLTLISAYRGIRDDLSFYGISYPSLNLPFYLQVGSYSISTLAIGYGIIFLAFLILLGLFVKKYIVQGAVPPFLAMVAFFSIYVWYIPVFYHPAFYLMIPFFHSLQYLLFVMTLERNKALKKASFEKTEEKKRKTFLIELYPYILLSVVLGALFFYFIPSFFDDVSHYNRGVFGSTLYLAVFALFINIHHYFIDNVLWRKDNPDIKEYLLQ
ncbi:MAG: hypothetical protein H6621_00230 [Halobacteriovoraceae bacterium]|nr:hypothetical protein [Halobacteriovoraceae bacterium]